jgi:hypothetical protein
LIGRRTGELVEVCGQQARIIAMQA